MIYIAIAALVLGAVALGFVWYLARLVKHQTGVVEQLVAALEERNKPSAIGFFATLPGSWEDEPQPTEDEEE